MKKTISWGKTLGEDIEILETLIRVQKKKLKKKKAKLKVEELVLKQVKADRQQILDVLQGKYEAQQKS